MNSFAWIGIIAWGLMLTAFGLMSAGPAPAASTDIQPHDVIFLIVGGFVMCMIGLGGLLGFTGWMPGLRKKQKNMA